MLLESAHKLPVLTEHVDDKLANAPVIVAPVTDARLRAICSRAMAEVPDVHVVVVLVVLAAL